MLTTDTDQVSVPWYHQSVGRTRCSCARPQIGSGGNTDQGQAERSGAPGSGGNDDPGQTERSGAPVADRRIPEASYGHKEQDRAQTMMTRALLSADV